MEKGNRHGDHLMQDLLKTLQQGIQRKDLTSSSFQPTSFRTKKRSSPSNSRERTKGERRKDLRSWFRFKAEEYKDHTSWLRRHQQRVQETRRSTSQRRNLGNMTTRSFFFNTRQSFQPTPRRTAYDTCEGFSTRVNNWGRLTATNEKKASSSNYNEKENCSSQQFCPSQKPVEKRRKEDNSPSARLKELTTAMVAPEGQYYPFFHGESFANALPLSPEQGIETPHMATHVALSKATEMPASKPQILTGKKPFRGNLEKIVGELEISLKEKDAEVFSLALQLKELKEKVSYLEGEKWSDLDALNNELNKNYLNFMEEKFHLVKERTKLQDELANTDSRLRAIELACLQFAQKSHSSPKGISMEVDKVVAILQDLQKPGGISLENVQVSKKAASPPAFQHSKISSSNDSSRNKSRMSKLMKPANNGQAIFSTPSFDNSAGGSNTNKNGGGGENPMLRVSSNHWLNSNLMPMVEYPPTYAEGMQPMIPITTSQIAIPQEYTRKAVY